MPAKTPLSSSELVTFSILVNGSEIDSTYQVYAVDVKLNIDQTASASIVILDGSPDTGTFPVSDSNDFIAGNHITIKAGYDSSNVTIFEGYVTSQEITISAEMGPTLTVGCEYNNSPTANGDTSPVFTLAFGESILEFNARTFTDSAKAISGRVSFHGSSLAIPGNMITLDKVGHRYSGDVTVCEMIHHISDGKWVSEAVFGPKILPKSIELADSSGNKIALSSNGIVIESAASLTLNAAKDLAVTATAGLNAKVSGGNIELSAQNINAVADTDMKLTGNASAELLASGLVKVQAAMVMIN